MSVYAVFFPITVVLTLKFAGGISMGGSLNIAEERCCVKDVGDTELCRKALWNFQRYLWNCISKEVYETLVVLWGVPCLLWGDSKPHCLSFWWEIKAFPPQRTAPPFSFSNECAASGLYPRISNCASPCVLFWMSAPKSWHPGVKSLKEEFI